MSKTIKNIVTLSFMNLVIFGLCFYLFSYIKKTDETVSSRLAQIESGVKTEEVLRSLKVLMDDTKKERDQIALIFVQPNGTVDFIETVESMGRIAGIKLEVESVGVNALKEKMSSSTELFRISLKTQGSWENTMHLLSLLESMPHKILFENVRLGKVFGGSDPEDTKGQTTSYWSGNFSFSALKIKNPQEKSVKTN